MIEKVLVAKAFGLEAYYMPPESDFEYNREKNTHYKTTEAVFSINGRYFSVKGSDPDDCWELAAEKLLEDIVKLGIVNYREEWW